jgi:hypothetical protein
MDGLQTVGEFLVKARPRESIAITTGSKVII